MNFNCDVCGREVLGCTFVNGMKFCAKCYQETFGNNTSKFVDLLNTEIYELKISNLEHKLEEKDQRIAELEEQLKKCVRPKFKIGKEVIEELIVDIRSLFNSYASSLIDYCIWNKNSDKNQKLYNNFKRVINDRLEKVLELFDKRIDQIQGEPNET